MEGMFSYTQAAMERTMKVQEVILRALAKKITWWKVAHFLQEVRLGSQPLVEFRPLTLRGRDIQSEAIRRRSRCGSVRGCPVVSSHFSPGPAPQVGQRTPSTCLRLGFLAFMVVDDARTER
jgi:hypothetical protein